MERRESTPRATSRYVPGHPLQGSRSPRYSMFQVAIPSAPGGKFDVQRGVVLRARCSLNGA